MCVPTHLHMRCEVDDSASKSPSKSPPKVPKQPKPRREGEKRWEEKSSVRGCSLRVLVLLQSQVASEERGPLSGISARQSLLGTSPLSAQRLGEVISLDKRCYSCCSQSQMVMAGFKPGGPENNSSQRFAESRAFIVSSSLRCFEDGMSAVQALARCLQRRTCAGTSSRVWQHYIAELWSGLEASSSEWSCSITWPAPFSCTTGQ